MFFAYSDATMDLAGSPKTLDADTEFEDIRNGDDCKLFDMSDDEAPLVIDDDPFDREMMQIATTSTQVNNRPDSFAVTSKIEIVEEISHVEFTKPPSPENNKHYSVDLDQEPDLFEKVSQTKCSLFPPSEFDQTEEFEDLVIPNDPLETEEGSASLDAKEEREYDPSSEDEELLYKKQLSVGSNGDGEEEAVRSDASPSSSPEKVGRWTFSGGAAKRPGRASKSSAKTAQEKEKFALHSESQRLFREANVDLLSYKPKEYSSVAEFRKALRGETAEPPSADNSTPKKVTTNSKAQSELESSDKAIKHTVRNLKLPESLPPPRPLKANDDDIIDLMDEDQPVIPAKGAKVYKRLTTLKKNEAALSASSSLKVQEYSVLRKVADANTGDVVLKMDKVTYKPSSRKPVTFTDRKMWAKHRQELKEIMRAKKLKQYAERMQDYQPAKASSKKSTNDSDEDDEWLEDEEDMSDISSESNSEDEEVDQDDDDGEDDDDDNENPNVSHTKKRPPNPFLDDEAEEDGDLLEEAEEFTDLDPNQLDSFKAPLPAEYKPRGEPGEVDLFLGDSTIMGDGSLKSLLATQSQSDSMWNATPYSLFYSQNRVEPRNDPPVVLSEPPSASLSTQSQNQSDGGTQATPTQTVEAPSRTQVVETPAVEKLPPKPRLMRVRDCAPPSEMSEEVARPLESSYPSYPLQTQVLKPLSLSDSGEERSSTEGPSQPGSQTQVMAPEGTVSADIFASSYPWETQIGRDTQAPVPTKPMDSIPEPNLVENDLPVQESNPAPAWMKEGKPKLKRVRDVICEQTEGFDHVSDPPPMTEALDQTQIVEPAVASPSKLQSTLSEVESSPSISFANSSVVTQIANDADMEATQLVEPESVPRKSRKRLRHDSDDESDEDANYKGDGFGDIATFSQPAKRRGPIFDAIQPVEVAGIVPQDLLPPVDMDEEENEEAAEGSHVEDDVDDDDVTGFSSEDDEEKEYLAHIRWESQVKAKKPTKFNADEFLDEEAELSGDEDELAMFRDDRAELEAEADNESDAGSLKDFVDETEFDEERVGKLRREVERVHNRIQEDEDLRNIRYLKERFFEDGDLYDEEGRTRQRRFRWRGLENEDPFAPRHADSDNDEDDDDGDGAAVATPAPTATPSGTNWITGGAGLMSRWLLNSASGTGSTEAPAAEGAKMTSTAEPELEKTTAAIANGESLVSNLGRKAVIPRRVSSYSGTGVGLKDATIPGMLTKSSSLVPPQAPKMLSLGKRGSLLGRFTAANSVKKPLNLASEEADNDDSNEGVEGGANAPASNRGLRGKIGLSCFSTKMAAGGDVVAIAKRTHFIKTPSMPQPSIGRAANSKVTDGEKRPLKSIFRALN